MRYFILLFSFWHMLYGAADECAGQKALKEILEAVKSDVADRSFAIDVPREILRGAQIHHALLQNDQDRLQTFAPTQNGIRAFIWWLYALGGKSFYEGTFVLPDTPEGAILSYLKNNPAVYERRSTHFAEVGALAQWGFDIADLPTKTTKRTILFGKAGEDADGNDLIFIKPETWGTATWPHYVMHAGSACVAYARKFRVLQFLTGSDDDEGYYKERIPKALADDFNVLMQKLEDSQGLSEDQKEQNHAKSISQMFAILQNIETKDAELSAEVRLLVEQLLATYDHITLRTGNEVIVLHEQMDDSMQQAAQILFKELIKKRVLGSCG